MAVYYFRFFMFVVGISVSYVILISPFYARRLIHDNPEVPYLIPHPPGVWRTRFAMLGFALIEGCAAAGIYYYLFNHVNEEMWNSVCFPSLLGCGISILYAPFRFWDRLRPLTSRS